MGKLVFQATLGGQVNLVGPNTASNYDINVPAVAGNMVTTGDTGTVTNTMCASSVYTAPGTIGSGTPNTGSFTSLAYSTTLTGGTGVVNLGSGQFYKDSSGNVGIGTASPSTSLTVDNKGGGTAASGGIRVTQSGWTGSYGYLEFDTVNTVFKLGATSTSFPLSFQTNSTERVRIDTSGNVLVGTTSALNNANFQMSAGSGASSTPYAAIFNTATSPTSSASTRLDFGFQSGTSNYVATNTTLGIQYFMGQANDAGYAGAFVQGLVTSGGNVGRASGHSVDLIFGTKASSSTGATEAMRINSNGNVGIGVTSPSARLAVQVSGMSNPIVIGQSSSSNYGSLSFNGNNNDGGRIGFTAGYSSNQNLYYDVTGSGAHVWRYGNNPDEAMRLNSSGVLMIGTTSPTTAGTKLTVYGSHDDWLSSVQNTNASPRGLFVKHNTDSNGTANWFLYCEAGTSTQRASIRSNGGLANYSANNTNLSDSREKTNVNPAGDYLAKICAIPVRTYNYIDQNLEEDAGLTLGVFAQDVQAVAPELVTESNWGSEEEPKMRLSIYQTDLQYALMKCIQEQQALITQLQADVAALKAA